MSVVLFRVTMPPPADRPVQ